MSLYPHSSPNLADTSLPVRDIETYLNNPTTQAALGVDPEHGNYSVIAWDLNSRFSASGDPWNFRAEHYLAVLLERGLRVLVYVGDTDWACNWVSSSLSIGGRCHERKIQR